MNLLIVEAEKTLCKTLESELPQSWRKWLVHTLHEAENILARHDVDVVLLGTRLPDGTGLDLLQQIRRQINPAEVFMLSTPGNVPEAVEAMRLGAFDVISKPVDAIRLENLILAAVRRRNLAAQGINLTGEGANDGSKLVLRYLPPNLHALGMQAVSLARTDIPILILGESGVGKDRFARFIHRASERSEAPFVSLNCAAVPEELLESEFFGHERGAFTGALARKTGFIEAAHGGTFFLDEIAEMSLTAQAKLLRTLDTGEYYRVGSTTVNRANLRFISATNQDLRAMIEKGEFREDFFFRINGFTIRIPPLRERPDDISCIAQWKSKQYAKRLSPDAMLPLISHHWPGNVRELLLVLERATALSGNAKEITTREVTLALSSDMAIAPSATTDYSLEGAMRRHIQAVLAITEGNQKQAAQLLGIDPKTLYRRLKEMREENV